MTGKVSEQNMQELDTDIVETSAHAGARPDHAVWQGKWFSFSGKSTTYPSLVEVTGYGTGAGLKGWNCRHDFYPVIPGISEPSYTEEELANIDPPPIEYNGKTLTYYECTQKQRAMETAMRKTKREIIAAEASDDEDMLTAKSILLRRQREEYAKFSKKAGLLTQNERTQVYGFGKSVAQKARWKAEKALDKLSEDAIMSMKGNLTNTTIRRWYVEQNKKIPDMIDRSKKLKEQAEQACELRNRHKFIARELMPDQEERKQLDITDPIESFEDIVKRKMNEKKISYDEALQDIVDSSVRTRKSVNKSLGLED